MRKWAAAAVIVLGALAALGAYRGGTYQGSSYGSHGLSYQAGTVGVDTFKVLSRDKEVPNTAAVTAGYVFSNLTKYTTVNSGGDGRGVKWGHVYRASPNTVYYDGSAPYQGYNIECATARNEDDFSWQANAALGFIWVSANGLKNGSRIESAYLMFNVAAFETYVVSAGCYVAARLDTISADYAATTTSVKVYATDTDTARMDISWNECDASGNKNWNPTLDNRLDRHDFGPRSDDVIGPGSYSGGTCLRLNVTDAVQQASDNGTLGRGLLFVVYGAPDIQTDNAFFSAGDYASWVGSTNGRGAPAFTCVSTSRRGVAPWNGVRVPIAMTFDDQYQVQVGWADAMIDSGKTFDIASFRDGVATAVNGWVDSLFVLRPTETQFIHHTRGHGSLGGMTAGQLPKAMSRTWYDSLLTGTGVPDTTKILDFAWPGGGSSPTVSPLAAEKMVDFGYRSCRGYGLSWTAANTGAPYETWLSWSGWANRYNIAAPNASAIFQFGGGASSDAQIEEALGDYVDKAYTDRARSALILYAHRYNSAPADYVSEAKLRYFIGLTNRLNSCQILPYRTILDLRLSGATNRPPDAMAEWVSAGVYTDVGRGTGADSNTVQKMAAQQDSVYEAGSHNNVLQMWIGPK